MRCNSARISTFVVIAGAVLLLAAQPALAQTGGEIFKTAATTIACRVMPAKFGVMLAGFSGIFALVAAVTGQYRGAWTLLFVSIGAFIFPSVIQVLFSGTVQC